MSNRFTQYILIAMALGIVMGVDGKADAFATDDILLDGLIPLYNKWFVARLPTGEKLNVAISPQLEEAFQVLNDTEGTSN